IFGGLFGGKQSYSSGGGWLSALGSIFGGFFAEGGRPPMGKVSVVGERGPELFVPDSPGTIIPGHAMRDVGSSAREAAASSRVQPIIVNQQFATGVQRAELASA